MLLEYAAQVKCLTERRVLATAKTIARLPRELQVAVATITLEAQRLIERIQNELADLHRRRALKQRQQRRIQMTRDHLKRAQQLLQHSENMVNGESTSQQSTPKNAATPPIADVVVPVRTSNVEFSQIESLTQQVSALKEQLEQFAKLQVLQHSTTQAKVLNGNANADVLQAASVSASIPITEFPTLDSANEIPMASSLAVACDVPQAPPLDIPTTPPLDIPTAPPLHPSVDSQALSPTSPPSKRARPSQSPSSSAKANPSASLVPEPTHRHGGSRQLEIGVTPQLSKTRAILSPRQINQQQQQQTQTDSVRASPCKSLKEELASVKLRPSSVNFESQVRESKAASTSCGDAAPSSPSTLPFKVFTRAIPGSDSLSHNDLIKVAAKIKLRQTPGILKSPGGTPLKQRDVGGDDFASQLLKRFASVRQLETEELRRRHRSSNVGEKENWDDNDF